MDFDMEMASAQIDHLCHLNNQLSAWWECNARGAHCHYLIITHKGHRFSRGNSGSSDSLETLLTLCSPAVDLRWALKRHSAALHVCGFKCQRGLTVWTMRTSTPRSPLTNCTVTSFAMKHHSLRVQFALCCLYFTQVLIRHSLWADKWPDLAGQSHFEQQMGRIFIIPLCVIWL